MKKLYLLATAVLFSVTAMSASAPSGDLYILGMNGNSTPDASNMLSLQPRSEEDIDEGIWRWSLPSVNIEQTEGSFTISDNVSLSLGYDGDNEFGLSNSITTAQAMVYLIPDGPAVNYSLPAGECSVSVVLFEDIYGENGKDSWIVQLESSAVEEEGNYYLLGFGGVNEPESSVCFKKIEEEADGEKFISYVLPKFLVKDCPDGVLVYGTLEKDYLGLNPEFSAPGAGVTDEAPMAFLSAGGEKVRCDLTEGYYSVSFSSLGNVSMISFNKCEDQTPVDEMEYYLLGVNGITSISDATKFKRETIVTEYEEDGQIIRDESIQYTLPKFKYNNAENGMTISSADGVVVFGYDSDMAAMLPNDLTDENPFALMAVNGEPIHSSLSAGEYDISFVITGNGTGMLSFNKPEDSGVVSVLTNQDQQPVFYDINGMVVKNPGKGVYIVRQGSSVKKIIRY